MIETWRQMRTTMAVVGFLSLALTGIGRGQSLADEEFTDYDFAQFFGLIADGKISREKMNARCEKEVVGFTFAAKDLVHDGGLERIDYNETGMTASVDGRALRSRHFNATFGEWTGAVFKPLCPGMWVISVDFTSADGPDGDVSVEDLAERVRLHLYLRRENEKRPGASIMRTGMVVSRASGHMDIALPLRTGDEISTYSEAVGSEGKRHLERVTFTAYKTGHLEKYVEEFDVDAWNADLEALK